MDDSENKYNLGALDNPERRAALTKILDERGAPRHKREFVTLTHKESGAVYLFKTKAIQVGGFEVLRWHLFIVRGGK